jgi:hypothetical protein
MANPAFHRLNLDWNAEPNAPLPSVDAINEQVRLRFFLNPWAYQAREGEIGQLLFDGCSRWRLGPTNDEGWYSDQCRYSRQAPQWGEFYEITGDDPLMLKPTDWQILGSEIKMSRHFLFYLRDEIFECLAREWAFSRIVA